MDLIFVGFFIFKKLKSAFSRLFYTFIKPNLPCYEHYRNQRKIYLQKFICLLFGHKMITTRTITSHIKEYKCTHCDLELTDDVQGHTTFLTAERKEINQSLKDFLQKKTHAA
jgi:hypothetical protein